MAAIGRGSFASVRLRARLSPWSVSGEENSRILGPLTSKQHFEIRSNTVNCPGRFVRTQSRTFLPGLATSSLSTRKVFSEQRILGYSPQQVFSVAENINDYKLFLPWCLDSQVLRQEGPDRLYGKLVVGFGPLREEYTSCVTMARHHYLKSVCSDGRLFSNLLAEWLFTEGPPHVCGPTCGLSVKVDFQFSSALHSAIAHMFYNEVVKTMVSAFQKRCHTLYGPDFLRQRQRGRQRVDYHRTN